MDISYLLDANICIYIRRKKPESVFRHFDRIRQGEAPISVVTYGELLYGPTNGLSPTSRDPNVFELLDIESPAQLPFRVLSRSRQLCTIAGYVEKGPFQGYLRDAGFLRMPAYLISSVQAVMARRTTLLIGFLVTIVTGAAPAQNSPKPAAQESGMTAYLQLLGTTNSEGTIYELNSDVGYDFNPHFGLTVGVPIYFIRPAASTGTSSATGLGDPYFAVLVRYPNPKLNFATLLVGAVPVGNSKEGLSTGRATFDWTGHIDHSFARLTPFVESGIANTTSDSTLYLRPYTTLGFNTHFRGGAYYDPWRFVRVGAAGFDILPTGQQTVFSRITHGQATNGTGRHGPPYLNSQQTTGTASIAHDDGFSTWVEVFRQHPVDFQVGFTRSFVYDLSSVSFGIGFDLGQLYRKSQR